MNMISPNPARTTLFALCSLACCSDAQALTLECEIGVAFGTKIGPSKTYTLIINDTEDFVMSKSGNSSRKLPILRRIETDETRALVLSNGDPSVGAKLVLSPDPPRLELALGSDDAISQTDLCRELSR